MHGNVQVEHVEQISSCSFESKGGTKWVFVYDHYLESFLLICGHRVQPVKHQKRLFDYIREKYYDQN